jgi:hypothetical protein
LAGQHGLHLLHLLQRRPHTNSPLSLLLCCRHSLHHVLPQRSSGCRGHSCCCALCGFGLQEDLIAL